jgi:subtilisin family serine protease
MKMKTMNSKKRIHIVAQRARGMLLAIILFALSANNLAADRYVSDEILISYRINLSELTIQQFEQQFSLVRIQRIPHLHLYVYKLPDTITVSEGLELFRSDNRVEHAEPNHLRTLNSLPSDPMFQYQWYLNNMGQPVNGQIGPSNIDIDWLEAMELYTGTEEIIVAIVDTGVAIDHPEILPNVWRNPLEDMDLFNSIDEDNNGYEDDAFGWDYFDGDPLPLDEHGHGTLIASIIAGKQDNNLIGTGIAPNAKIMALRVADDFGSFGNVFVATLNFLLATTYAAENGAKIINASFGGGSPNVFELEQLEWLHEQNVLFVAAAGNGGSDRLGDNNDQDPIYPASYDSPNIISVAAIDRTGGLASFSNYGANLVDVAAPGTDILGADITRTYTFDEGFENDTSGWLQGSNNEFIWSRFSDNSGNTWLTDSVDDENLATDYQANTYSWVTSPPIDVGYFGPQLEYRIWYDLEYFVDFLWIQVSVDNGFSWSLIDFVSGDCFSCNSDDSGTVRKVDLSDYAGLEIKIRFLLTSDESIQSDGIYIDDVKISEVTLGDYDVIPHTYLAGTSFAAPIVAGIAALLWSQKPALGNLWVKEVLVASTDDNALEGMVRSGGSISASRALKIILEDQDVDGIDNGDEFILGTNPWDPDTDADGVWDNIDIFPLNSNRTHSDSDNDGVDDNFDVFPDNPNKFEVDQGFANPLTGLWWNPDESGWGVTLNQQGNIIFATLFTYDSDGIPVWYVASNCTMEDESSCSGELYKVVGGTAMTDEWNGENKIVEAVGNITFTFVDEHEGKMNFDIDGQLGNKNISRQVFGSPSPNTPMTALWWNPDESGWGVTLTRQNNIAFATIFTYTNNGFPVWYVASNCTINNLSCTGELYEVSGATSLIDIWNDTNKNVIGVGEITFDFSDEDNGMIQYTINGLIGMKTITRQVFN